MLTSDDERPEWTSACLAHLLRADEREAFERDGFLMVPGALDPQQLGALRDAAEHEAAAFRADPGVMPHEILNLHGLIGRDDSYLGLIDLPTTFPKVWGLLGWHIQVFHTQLIVTPPAPVGAGAGGYGWHQDNNRMNLDLGGVAHPRISVKVGWFLSDVRQAGRGNLCVVPGSHERGRPEVPLGEQPVGAVEVLADAGDAIVFDRRLWHAASANRSDMTRILVTVGYSHRWLRPKSEPTRAPDAEQLSPVRRQLLGATTSANAWFEPTDDDVPLRTWIRSTVGDDAVAP